MKRPSAPVLAAIVSGAVLFLSCVPLALAIHGSLGVETGYDDNPGLNSTTAASAFVRWNAGLRQGFTPFSKTILDVQTTISYSDYLDTGDHYRIQAVAEISRMVAEGRIQPFMATGGAFFRDRLIKEDDRNEFLINPGIELYPFDNMWFRLSQSFLWMDFRRPSTPLAGRAAGMFSPAGMDISGRNSQAGRIGHVMMMSHAKPDNHHHACQGNCPVDFSDTLLAPRDDRLEKSDVTIHSDITRVLAVETACGYQRLFSSSRFEAFSRHTIDIGLTASPWDALEFNLRGQWAETRYRDTPSISHRVDYTRTVEAGIYKAWEKADLSARFMWSENDSPVAEEKYRRRVISVGLSWYF